MSAISQSRIKKIQDNYLDAKWNYSSDRRKAGSDNALKALVKANKQRAYAAYLEAEFAALNASTAPAKEAEQKLKMASKEIKKSRQAKDAISTTLRYMRQATEAAEDLLKIVGGLPV